MKSKTKMYKSELISAISERIGCDQQHALANYSAMIEIIKEELVDKGEFRLSGLGVLVLKKRGERKMNNPRTGERVTTLPSVGISFRPSPTLKRSIGNIVFNCK